MNEWAIIGAPTSAGAHHAGQDLAPAALRAAGLPGRLQRAGLAITDAGDLPGAIFTADRAHPAARNVLGGDCTITIGAVAG